MTGTPSKAGTRLRAALLVVFAAGVMLHQAPFWDWFVEDAAISFAYARNWVAGDGLVAMPGGERVEGYSNFTWVVLLALGELVGIDGFSSAKPLQMLLGALTVPLTYLVAREATPRGSDAALVAPAFLAISSTFAVWGACGLENALFNFLLAAALWRSVVEVRAEGPPVSAVLWMLLAISRPEAPIYACVAFLWTVAVRARRPGWVLRWLAVFSVPLALYHLVRFSYFAFEFPQTYYGKLSENRPDTLVEWITTHLAYKSRGMRYVRNWSHAVGVLYFLPVWLVGVTSSKGWRLWTALGLGALTGLVILIPDSAFWVSLGAPAQPAGTSWNALRVAILGIDFVAVCAMTLGRPQWQGRILTSGIAASVLFFTLHAQGDWMKHWRWMSLLQVPLAVLLASGVGTLAWAFESLDERLAEARTSVIAFVSVGVLTPLAYFNLQYTGVAVDTPVTTPGEIRHRLEYVQSLKQRLGVRTRFVDLDVDMGAHMWWGADDLTLLDIAGLVDIPMAQHRFQRPFIDEYLFKEQRPHYAHVHGAWARTSKIPTHGSWRSEYIEIDPYPGPNGKPHPGNHIRRDLVMRKTYRGRTDRRTEFEDGLVLAGFEAPSEAAAGRKWFIEIAVQDKTLRDRGEEPSLFVFAHRGGQLAHVWDIPLGYGWFDALEWRTSEVNVGRYELEIPEALGGTYAIGFVFTDGDGRSLTASRRAPTAWVGGEVDKGDPVFAVGEVNYDDVLTVVDIPTMVRLANADRDDAIARANRGECRDAEATWERSLAHQAGNVTYLESNQAIVHEALANCWAAFGESHPDQIAFWMRRAREFDPRATGVLSRAHLADGPYERGAAALSEERWDDAYREFTTALAIDPTRSWARRYAEQARAHRLRLEGP